MKRKLRKSLSWLLTVAMIFSLFCGMIPTASAAAVNNDYITVEYDNDGVLNNKITVNVILPDGTQTQSIVINC